MFYVEIYRDVVLSLAGVSSEQAVGLIKRTKPHQMLSGARGGARLDIDALAHAVVAVSDLMLTHPSIEEIDLNPVFV